MPAMVTGSSAIGYCFCLLFHVPISMLDVFAQCKQWEFREPQDENHEGLPDTV